ncbi:glutathione S-transferase [Macroventuria anomochaeta]|uniref:Glutathione S-transferase n=1 Tax=Macroventuria anomochaeta TaxID=301207 RepID=A0ACB6RYS7_9PLEO|nr:glutathione S-transferase [Macroventuria anomochaeta]KAF2626309.1 glutathione S-transferase [Macroventuria anomochaeta]
MATPNFTVHHLQIGQGERIPWLLEELEIPYKLVNYQRSPLLSPPELKSKHPLGASPILEDHTDPSNPITLAESGAIVEYIIGKYANGKLALGPSHKNFADYLYWFHFSNSTLQPAIFRRAMLRGAIPNSSTDARYLGADGRVKNALHHMNNRLLSHKWLAGDEFTAADVMTGWCLTTMRKFEPIDLTEYEGIQAWVKRFGERQAYKTAMGKSDPNIDLEETSGVKGPAPIELFTKAMAGKM